jgi:hypothetical protein
MPSEAFERPLCEGPVRDRRLAQPPITAPGPPLDYMRPVFNLRPSVSSADCSTNPRRFEAKLAGLKTKLPRAMLAGLALIASVCESDPSV